MKWCLLYDAVVNKGCDLADNKLNQGIPLITYEKSEPKSKKKIKIPDVCMHFGVSYYSTIEMFRLLGESF